MVRPLWKMFCDNKLNMTWVIIGTNSHLVDISPGKLISLSKYKMYLSDFTCYLWSIDKYFGISEVRCHSHDHRRTYIYWGVIQNFYMHPSYMQKTNTIRNVKWCHKISTLTTLLPPCNWLVKIVTIMAHLMKLSCYWQLQQSSKILKEIKM
jgi:hypothetical protein